MSLSDLPTLDLFEGLTRWGKVRLRPEGRDNTMKVELKRDGEEWKPIFTFIAVAGKIAFRIDVGSSGRDVVYDPSTGTFSNLAPSATHRPG